MFPSRPAGFSRGTRLRPSKAPAGSEFEREARPSRPLTPQSVLYPAGCLRAGLAATSFGGNQLSPSLIGLLPLGPGQGRRIARQHPCGPPPGFRPASPCPGLDRSVSGSHGSDSGPFQTPPLAGHIAQLRAVGFPTPTGVVPLKLATAVNSPARAPKRKT